MLQFQINLGMIPFCPPWQLWNKAMNYFYSDPILVKYHFTAGLEEGG